MSEERELGVSQVAKQIHVRLQRYLEAQYHIKDTGLIDERRSLLEEPGGISQRPFVEVTPSYASAPDFNLTGVPKVVTELLGELQTKFGKEIGVFPPFRHQAEALQSYFIDGERGHDLLVATGTGSGKTETFLYAMLGKLALEASSRPASYGLPGVRVLLLYPMNALVSDQTARLRKLLGSEAVAQHFRTNWSRHPMFGMYTSRTPYPGPRALRKEEGLAQLVGHYADLEVATEPERIALVKELKRKGRWPAKDVLRFFAKDREVMTTYKRGKNKGKPKVDPRYLSRFFTQPGDRELLTRHEILARAPDLLITNYSMLEYMLLRPIERSIFAETKTWLESDERNQLLLILDEAHMYRGVGGAEVGLLIRRLQARLGVGRDRLRCILTSASIGSNVKDAGLRFAEGLTGKPPGRGFKLIGSTLEPRAPAGPGDQSVAQALAQASPTALAAALVDRASAKETIEKVATRLGWGVVPSLEGDPQALVARQFVCEKLTGLPVLELLISLSAGKAQKFGDLARDLFPGVEPRLAEAATDGLLALGNFARRLEPSRSDQPLLPTRVHLLFRGLPALFVCVDKDCAARRKPEGASIAGRVYTEARTHCECGARVFELLTHRDCGAAFLRAYSTSTTPEFFWHERGGRLQESGEALHEHHLLLEKDPHPKQHESVQPFGLDLKTGRVVPVGSKGSRMLYRASKPVGEERNLSTFGTCPSCGRATRSGHGALKIMDLATKGEQPFANLVREQFVTQLATKAVSQHHPNGGRKTLLFSDGRQKAARLARDLPREVERDSMREALVLAVDALSKSSKPEAVLDKRNLYVAFVAVCATHHLHFFDGEDQRVLLENIRMFREDYDGQLDRAREMEWEPEPPRRFRTALARQIGDQYYSLAAACAAVVEPRAKQLFLLEKRLKAIKPDVLRVIATEWIRKMLLKSAFDPAIGKRAREEEFPFFTPTGVDDGLEDFFTKLEIPSGLGPAQIQSIRQALFELFTEVGPDATGQLLTPSNLVLRLALRDSWLQCVACGQLQSGAFLGCCANCFEKVLEPRPPEHPYMTARKGFFREPLNAVLSGAAPVHITAEEHTAQLSQRDAGVVYATTEEFELRFQDIALGPDSPPVDVLSCTTTMEVGIDIGSLTAVGLRTVPPQRENYQQRAGRAGRRGTSVSSVVTYAQGGAHDGHYFANPAAIISGPPREPRLKADNARLARRHINAYLLQTFFHEHLDALSQEEIEDLARARRGIMSAFGPAADFFGPGAGLSLSGFEEWVGRSVLTKNAPVAKTIARWLPPELMPAEGAREEFVRDSARAFLDALVEVQARYVKPPSAPQESAPEEADEDDAAEGEDEGAGMLLDLLFDEGLLPSYAFPTDLCSFVIQERNAKTKRVEVAERPQLGKAQALSEYAPGRLLVVNKKTYRVGGIFFDNPMTTRPAAAHFARPLPRYIGCSRCSFVRLELPGSGGPSLADGSACPVCTAALVARDFIDPPAFSPEAGDEVREGDREQDLTYASSAQLPEIAESAEFKWSGAPTDHLRHAYGQDVLLVVANKGKDSTGFAVCETCGAAWLDEDAASPHKRPFLVAGFVAKQEQAGYLCNGTPRRGLFLAHEFRTDVLLLRIALDDPFDGDPNQSALTDALQTCCEALALAASLHLDIDPGEIQAGYRLLPHDDANRLRVELFLYDTAAGGAGYAADAGADLTAVLARTEQLLTGCDCERSCTNCLRHYGNRFHHPRLDRGLAMTLVRFMRSKAPPAPHSADRQRALLAPLAHYLALEGWVVSSATAPGRPLVAKGKGGEVRVIGVYPALIAHGTGVAQLGLSTGVGEAGVGLSDYVLTRDLPTAYKIAVGIEAPKSGASATQKTSLPPAGHVIEVPEKELRAIGTPQERELRRVKLRSVDVVPPDGAFASRIPSGALTEAGFKAGSWVVLRPVSDPSEFTESTWVAVRRKSGNFDSTRDAWTLAHVKDGGAHWLLKFGAAKGKAFRAQKVEKGEIVFVGVVASSDLETA
jgi:ATP-dependent helicase YprA (DUF1998 family)